MHVLNGPCLASARPEPLDAWAAGARALWPAWAEGSCTLSLHRNRIDVRSRVHRVRWGLAAGAVRATLVVVLGGQAGLGVTMHVARCGLALPSEPTESLRERRQTAAPSPEPRLHNARGELLLGPAAVRGSSSAACESQQRAVLQRLGGSGTWGTARRPLCTTAACLRRLTRKHGHNAAA